MSVHPTYIHSPRAGLAHGYSNANGYAGGAYTNGYAGSGYANGYAAGSGAPPPQTARSTAPTVQGFMFRSRQERIDWKKIAAIDVERITREFDVNGLQDSMMGITFCDIEREIDTRMVDQNFVTVFKLAQLIIQYLLHSQEVMAHNASMAEERVMRLHADHETTKQDLGRLSDEMQKVRHESHKRKKQLRNQQTLIQATANNYHKCMYCEKAFMTISCLQSHMTRRHPEFTPRPAGQMEDNVAVKKVAEMNEKMEREMEELRERLKFSESQLVEQSNRTEEQLKMALQRNQQHSQVDVDKQEEMHRKELERWKNEQLQLQKVEMEKMQNMFMGEMKEMHEKYTSSATALENIQSKLGKQSMLGSVVDEDELEEYRKKSEKQNKEIRKLRDQIQSEVSSIEHKMSDEMRKVEEKWKDKQKAVRSHHKEEVKELKGLLEHTKQLLNIERQGGDKKGAKYERQMEDLLKKNKEYERQIRTREEKIKELKEKSSKHYEVVEPRLSPPPRMTISDEKNMAQPYSDDDEEEEEEDTDMGGGMDTLSRVLQESESWLTGTHPSYHSDIAEDELDGTGYEQIDQQTFQQNKERIVRGLKDELTGVLQRNMEKRGIPEGMKGISAQSLENKIKVLKQERQSLAKNHLQFYDIRERFKREVDRRAAELRKSGKPTVKVSRAVSPQPKVSRVPATPPPAYTEVAAPNYDRVKPRGKPQPQPQNQKQNAKQKQQLQQQQQQSWQQKQNQRQKQQQQQQLEQQKKPLQPAIKKLSPGQVKAPPPIAPRSPQMNGRGRGKATTSKQAARVSFEDSEEEDESSEEEESGSFGDSEDEEEDHYKKPSVPPRAAAHSQPATNGFHKNGITEGQEEEEDEDSQWDSEEIDELEEKRDRAPVTKPPVTSVRKTKGPLVSSLSRSIELQLSGRHQGQKPVGGVDIGAGASKPPQPAPRTPSPSPTPRIPTIPDAGAYDDDDDETDSGSVSVSSFQDSFSAPAMDKTTSPTPAPRAGTGKLLNNDTDMSSNTYNTSMWGSSKARGTGTGKSSIVSVTDFDDDDDDFGIDDL